MNHIISEKQLLEALHWRYATKTFDASKKIPEATLKTLEEVLVLSPSSYGLQPYRFLIVKDSVLRAKLQPHSWNQSKVVEASHYVVMASRTTLTEKDVDTFIDRIVEVRGISRESLEEYRKMICSKLCRLEGKESIANWAARQTYIALGNLMTSASLLNIDTCAVEGFSPEEYDTILGLKDTAYASVVCCALGYRSASDQYASLAKVRFPLDTLIQSI